MEERFAGPAECCDYDAACFNRKTRNATVEINHAPISGFGVIAGLDAGLCTHPHVSASIELHTISAIADRDDGSALLIFILAYNSDREFF